MPVEKSETSKEWGAWAGGADRLLRLAHVLGEVGTDGRRAAIEKLDLERDRAIEALRAEGAVDAEYRIKSAQVAADDARRRVEDAWRTELTAKERELATSFKGAPADVVEEVDWRSVTAAELTAGGYNAGGRIAIRFSRLDGVRIDVSSNEPRFVRQASATLESEIRRDVPRWAWSRTFNGGIWLSGAFALVVTMTAAVVTGDDDASVLTATLASVPFTIFGYLGGAWLWFGMRRLLPGFEVVPTGALPRGTRVLRWAGSLLVALIVGVVTGLIVNAW